MSSENENQPAGLAETDVLIVGGGSVGLALAGDLGWRGVPCLVVERGDGDVGQPRMTLVGVRTMEYCRRWGIVSWVEDCPFPRDRPQDNVYVTSLTGYEFGRESFPALEATQPLPESPQHRYRCPQDMFNPILRRHAASYPSVAIRHETTFQALEESEDFVMVTVSDSKTGAASHIRAKYVVGCDGAASRVRELIESGMEGPGTLTYTTNVIFHCPDLDTLHDKSDAYRWIFIGEEGTWATLVAINGRDLWRFSLIGDDQPQTLTPDDLQAAIRRAVGIDREFEIRSVLPWIRREGVAKRYGRGRVFIAGDACHLMSPTGGFGMNTGIGDTVDLSWKLDAVLAGWGGPTLLDTYEIERRPVAVRNAAEASGNLSRMLEPRRVPPPTEVWLPGPAGDDARRAFGAHFGDLMTREWNSIGIHLGYDYAHSPLCAGDPDATSTNDVGDYVQTTAPGSRAPHVWLPDGRSTLDWYGRGFVLVQTSGQPELAREIVDAALAQGLPLRVERPRSQHVAEAYERSLVLVRPDGHVAWRSDEGLDAVEAHSLIEQVRGASRTSTTESSALSKGVTA